MRAPVGGSAVLKKQLQGDAVDEIKLPLLVVFMNLEGYFGSLSERGPVLG